MKNKNFILGILGIFLFGLSVINYQIEQFIVNMLIHPFV